MEISSKELSTHNISKAIASEAGSSCGLSSPASLNSGNIWTRQLCRRVKPVRGEGEGCGTPALVVGNLPPAPGPCRRGNSPEAPSPPCASGRGAGGAPPAPIALGRHQPDSLGAGGAPPAPIPIPRELGEPLLHPARFLGSWGSRCPGDRGTWNSAPCSSSFMVPVGQDPQGGEGGPPRRGWGSQWRARLCSDPLGSIPGAGGCFKGELSTEPNPGGECCGSGIAVGYEGLL